MTSTWSSFTSFCTCWIAVAGVFASSASTNWILRPPTRLPCAFTYATKPRLTSMEGALFGPLNVSRLPIFSGFVADFLAIPAHARDPVANGILASATPPAARFRNSRRSRDPELLASLTFTPSVARMRRRPYKVVRQRRKSSPRSQVHRPELANREDGLAVLAHRLAPVLARLPAEAAVHRDTEVVQVLR